MKRPHVTINVASSIDGKIATSARGKLRFTSDHDRRLMDELRAGSDGVLIGAATLRAEDPPMQVRDPSLRQSRQAEGRDERLLNIVLSGSLNLPLSGRFFSVPGVRRIVATVEDARAELAARLAPFAEVLRVGRGRVDIRALLEALSERGIERLLVEGGGEVNASFLEADCVDELYVTIAPTIIGGRTSPTPVDGEGFLPGAFPAFELLDCRRVEQEAFLRYRRVSGG